MPFASNKQALKEIKIINAENKRWSKNRKANANKKASTYWCLECEAWHLTTMPKNVLKIKGYKKR